MPQRRADDLRSTYSVVLEEVSQGHTTRLPLYKQLHELLGQNKLVVSIFTSFKREALLNDEDADMLEEVLQNSKMDSPHVLLILNSAGGFALPAERIVNILQSYSKSGFTVVVPKMAKSAATMICFGAEEIWMSQTSELGPIDPQIPIYDENGKWSGSYAAHEIIESYEGLIKKANETRGRLEPFLQQLARFDARDIRRIKSAQELSENVATKCLKGGLMKGLSEKAIKKKIEPFLKPKYTKVHGRPIYHDVAEQCGLNIKRHCCPVKSRRESTGCDLRVKYPGSQMLPRPVKLALFQKE